MAYYHPHLSGLSPVVDDALDLRLELPLEQVHARVARLLGVVDARQRRRLLSPFRRRRRRSPSSSSARRRREQVSGHYPSPSIHLLLHLSRPSLSQIALVTYILRPFRQSQLRFARG